MPFAGEDVSGGLFSWSNPDSSKDDKPFDSEESQRIALALVNSKTIQVSPLLVCIPVLHHSNIYNCNIL